MLPPRVLLDRAEAAPADVLEMVSGADATRWTCGRRSAMRPCWEATKGLVESGSGDSGMSDSPDAPEATPLALKRPLYRAESDNCPNIVAVLDDKRRVISDGVQWILQQRTSHRWAARSYCRTKEALIRCCGGSTPELEALPDRIGDRIALTTDMQEVAE
jgi:hypothetical protein